MKLQDGSYVISPPVERRSRHATTRTQKPHNNIDFLATLQAHTLHDHVPQRGAHKVRAHLRVLRTANRGRVQTTYGFLTQDALERNQKQRLGKIQASRTVGSNTNILGRSLVTSVRYQACKQPQNKVTERGAGKGVGRVWLDVNQKQASTTPRTTVGIKRVAVWARSERGRSG